MHFGQATHLAVLDFETTGLDIAQDEIIEVGAILVALDGLTEVAQYTRIIQPTEAGMQRLVSTPAVKEMHEANGLLEQIESRGAVSREEYRADLLGLDADLTELAMIAGPQKSALAGSGIANFDLPIVKAYFPSFAGALTHTPLDISMVRRMAAMTGVETPNFNEAKTRRSIDDVRCHLAEINHWVGLFGSLAKEKS